METMEQHPKYINPLAQRKGNSNYKQRTEGEMFFASSLAYSSPHFATIRQNRREIRANSRPVSSSCGFILSPSPNPKEIKASLTFLPISTFLKSALQNCCHLLISGAFVLSSLHVNDIAYAIDKSKAAFKFPCEEISTYYKDLEGLERVDLAKRLNSIVSPHRSLPYKQVWEALKVLDAADIDHPEFSSEVIEIYTQRPVSKELAGKPEGWNKTRKLFDVPYRAASPGKIWLGMYHHQSLKTGEHLWPKSYGLEKGPARTDLHNLRPADVNVNSARGNKYYGECSAASARCTRPATREAAPDTEADSNKWAPPFQVRGDIARSLMYMAICYGFYEPDGSPYLQLSNSPSPRKHEMGLLSTLLKWNEIDPPSRSENLRNDRVCKKYQHNRNPFIDHPEYANLIWGHLSPRTSYLFPSIPNDRTDF